MMESKPKRARKICYSCKLEFSDIHARRHMLECSGQMASLNSDHNAVAVCSPAAGIDMQMFSDKEITDSDNEIDYTKYKIDVRPRKETIKDLEDEDIRAYFDG